MTWICDDYFRCHCVTTKQDVSFVCSLLMSGSSFMSDGAKSFFTRGGTRKISELRTSKNATLPRCCARFNLNCIKKSRCKRSTSIDASLSEKKRSKRYQTRRAKSGNDPLCG